MPVSKRLLTFSLPCRSVTSKRVALLGSRKNQCRAVPVDKMPKRKIFEGERKYRVVGYREYENTWPAIRHTGIGIIFVYDGDISSEELENW